MKTRKMKKTDVAPGRFEIDVGSRKRTTSVTFEGLVVDLVGNNRSLITTER
jgi:hypothetical protein